MSNFDCIGFCKEMNFLGGENFVGRRSMHVSGNTLLSGCLHERMFYNKIHCLAILIKSENKRKINYTLKKTMLLFGPTVSSFFSL